MFFQLTCHCEYSIYMSRAHQDCAAPREHCSELSKPPLQDRCCPSMVGAPEELPGQSSLLICWAQTLSSL